MEHIVLNRTSKENDLRLVSLIRLNKDERVLINQDKEKNKHIALRTNEGDCSVKVNKTTFEIPQNSIFVTPAKNTVIVSNESNYKTDIFLFKCAKLNACVVQGKHIHVPYSEWETNQSRIIDTCLKNKNENSMLLLNSVFGSLYYNWAFSAESFKQPDKFSNAQIEKAAEYISKNLDQKINMKELSKHFNYSERNFRKLFKDVTGMSPKNYQQEMRLSKARQLLSDSDMTISEISEKMGYYSQFQFSSVFKMKFGLTPTQYKAKMK